MGGQTFHLMPLTEYVGRSHIFYHIWEDCSNWRGEQERAGALHTGGYVPDTTICCVENLFAGPHLNPPPILGEGYCSPSPNFGGKYFAKQVGAGGEG